jgi:anti-sigma factor RsiW
MKCEKVRRLLDTYLDGELGSARQLELQQHLASCPSCQSLVEERREFRAFFADGGPKYRAPAQLEAKVLAAVRQEQARQKPPFFWQPWVYATAAAGVFLALYLLFPDIETEFSKRAVLRHSQSLSAEHLVDVASSDPAVVKSWFRARLDFDPPIVVSPAAGYSLLGGRVDRIQNRPVATLVYKHDDDVVTLFCWPPNKEQLSTRYRSIEGCHVATWSNAECNYILVSRLSDRAMDEFMDSFRVRIQSGAYF